MCFIIWILFTFAFPPTTSADPSTTQPVASPSFLENGNIRLGVDPALGGAITWLSKSSDKTNLINSSDWGRQIQMSFYSGPVPFTPDGNEPKPEWRGLGWNPIQCGDAFGNRAKLLALQNDGKELFIRCTPMQWPLNNVPGDCTFESHLTLNGNTVRAMCRLLNRRSDVTQYPARDQELPAVYTNGPWWRLMTYAGEHPFTDAPLTQIPAKMPWSQWNATEHWAALVDDKDWGLGIWIDGVNHFTGGFAGKPGAGGAKDIPCGYIAPTPLEILDQNIEYNYAYVLILGSVSEIRKYAVEHSKHNILPEYHFESDRQHWYYHDAADAGWPIRGQLDIHTTGNDSYFLGPLTAWQSSAAGKVRIEAAFDHTQPTARVRWKTFAKDRYSDEEMASFPVKSDGEFRVYEVDLSKFSTYVGAMSGLRIDPLIQPGVEGRVRIKSIVLAKD